ncbi:bacteriophage T4 gp5 trimerisation domain-containing protein [Nitrosopumilus cobalaminigenes]|nr:hypothetical protein [Nitrosopumilus cobalaminigenes]
MAGCRDDQSLVYRSTYLDFICVDPTTAERWAELGIAEIVQNSTSTEKDESEIDIASYEEKYPGAPPPPPVKSPEVNYTSECRGGQVLIYQFSYRDTICANMFTALTWERLGMAEIVETEKPQDHVLEIDPGDVFTVTDSVEDEQTLPVEDEQTLPVEDEQTLPVEDEQTLPVEDEQTLPVEDEQTLPVEDEQTLPVEDEQTLPVEDEQTLPVEDEQTLPVENNLIDDSDFPKIQRIADGIWSIIDFDKSSSIFIEGENGIIVIDSLNSYKSNEKAITEFKTISDKKIKSIVLTTISPEIVSALTSFIKEGDSSVEIVLSEKLLDIYTHDHDLSLKNIIIYEYEISLNVSNVLIDIVTETEVGLAQTYLSLPRHDGILVGNSNYGVFPFILNIDYLPFFNTE